MGTLNYTPLQNGYTRIFLIDGRARPDHAPTYESCYILTGLSQSFGDVTKIECPDPLSYNKFIEIGQVRGAAERATATVQGRFAADLRSKLLRMARQGCAIDVQVHMGKCTDPSAFNTYTKGLILEDALLSTFGTDDLGALSSGDQNPVNETADVSAVSLYEVVPLTFATKADSVILNEIMDVVICDTQSCGDCEVSSTGDERIYAVTKGAGGSPTTPPDLLISLDKGVTWIAHDIDTMAATDEPLAVACVGDYVVVADSVGNSLHYTTKAGLNNYADPSWTEVTTGFVATKVPRAMASYGNRLFIVAAGGYVYYTDSITSGVTVADAGAQTVAQLNDVDALNSEFAVAVGNDGKVLKTTNGTTWALVTGPVGVGINILCVQIKSKTEWLVGTSDGRLFYTVNGGGTWALKGFPGSGTGTVQDIAMSSNSVLYVSHTTAATRGRILRSVDGGYSWVVLPELTSTSMPLADRFTTLAAGQFDQNFVVAAGLGDNGTDGILVVGQ